MPDVAGGIVIRDHRGRSHERRDPTAGTVNTSYTGLGAPMLPEWDAAAAIRSAYYANIFVYRCVQVRARALAALPFRVGADPTRPKDYDPKAPLAQLLGPPPGGPNKTTTARRLWAWTLAQKIVSGRYAWEVETDQRDRPVGLWPLPTSQLKPIPSKGGARYFDGFKFGSGTNVKTLQPEQVVYAWNPSQHDWRQPESALQAARLDISIAVMQNRYDFAFLKNDARPAAVVVTREFEDDDAFQQFKDQMLGEHRGPDNTGKLAFIEDTSDSDSVLGSIEIHQLGLSQTDAAFIQREQQKISAICMALGVPMSKLGDASRRTFNNAGQETLNFETDTVIPDAHDLEDEINLTLAPLMGDGLVGWFDLSSLAASQSRRFTQVGLVDAYKAEIITQEEARAEIGFEPLDETTDVEPDADAADEAVDGLLLVQKAQAFNFLAQTLTPESAALLAGLDVTAVEAKPAPAQAGVLSSEDLAELRSIVREPRTATPDDRAAAAEARRAATWAEADARAALLEHTMTRQMQKLFARQETSTLTRLQNKRGRQLVRDLTLLAETRAADDPAEDLPDATDLFDRDFWQAETADTAEPVYEQSVAAGGRAIASKFGVVFDLAQAHVQDFITARANNLAGHVTDTTYRAIQTALADGVSSGWSIDQLADAIRGVFAAASEQRAETIARTEVLSAYNGAQALEAALLPEDVVAGKEWVSVRDERVRDAHADADGQTVGTVDPFSVEDEDLLYPGDPNGSPDNIINCRCTLAYLTPDEMPEAAGPRRRREVELRVASSLLRELVAA